MGILDSASELEIEIYNCLKCVIDPEIGINIVDLGLIYKIEYDTQNGIQVEMTLSSRGCPMGDVIEEDINRELQAKFPLIQHTVTLVWEPKWSVDFVTENGRQSLNLL